MDYGTGYRADYQGHTRRNGMKWYNLCPWQGLSLTATHYDGLLNFVNCIVLQPSAVTSQGKRYILLAELNARPNYSK